MSSCREVMVLLLLASIARADAVPLLMGPTDLARVRHLCGVAADPEMPQKRFGAYSRDYRRVRAFLADRLPGEPLSGEPLAAAFLLRVEPSDPEAAKWRSVVTDAMQSRVWVTTDPLELGLALCWCWDQLPRDVRVGFLRARAETMEPLEPGDSPLRPLAFRRRLFALAVALATESVTDRRWATQREALLTAAHDYFRKTFPRFVAARGLIPTSPAFGAQEEADTAIALELAGVLARHSKWKASRATVGRWMEHYVFGRPVRDAGLPLGFIRDRAGDASLLPLESYRQLQPLTAHLIADRTRDPCAAWVAAAVDRRLRSRAPGADVWRWVPIVFDLAEVPVVDERALPLARNLGHAVVIRNEKHAPARLWIDAAQPYLRQGQHFDAGHFLIDAGGYVAGAAGEDIARGASALYNGRQQLGRNRESFVFEQFFTSTIAHNTILLWDSAFLQRWYDKAFEPRGGQLVHEGTVETFPRTTESLETATGRMLAYGQQDHGVYVALDLAPAYGPRRAGTLTREFLLLDRTLLLLVDRVRPARARVQPTWVLNIPARPRVNDDDLLSEWRVSGDNNKAGVWQIPDDLVLRWEFGTGALRFVPLLPRARSVRAIGGPAEPLRIADGDHAGRRYVGSSADGFEHLVVPSSRYRPENAWYRLGAPPKLGRSFGQIHHWGRIEVESADPRETQVFLNLMVIESGRQAEAIDAQVRREDESIVCSIRSKSHALDVRLPSDDWRGGTVTWVGDEGDIRWSLPSETTADMDLPTRRLGG